VLLKCRFAGPTGNDAIGHDRPVDPSPERSHRATVAMPSGVQVGSAPPAADRRPAAFFSYASFHHTPPALITQSEGLATANTNCEAALEDGVYATCADIRPRLENFARIDVDDSTSQPVRESAKGLLRSSK
jgi:hypothetical protein